MKIVVSTLVVLVLCACTRGAVAGTPPTSAKDVVLHGHDLSVMQKCPESDRWAGLMLTGEPEMLPTGFATWADLKVAGATEGWLSMYADNVIECPLLFGAAPPKGRLVYTVAIKFKTSSTAAASFANDSKTFPVAADFFDRFSAAGGKLSKGASTGFGDNSAVATISPRGVLTYVAFWQNKDFEAIVWGDNLSASEAVSAVGRMNGRIR